MKELEELVARWRKFADTDYTTGQKLGDSRKQAQYELIMAGQSLAYAIAAKELEDTIKVQKMDKAKPLGNCPDCGHLWHTGNEFCPAREDGGYG